MNVFFELHSSFKNMEGLSLISIKKGFFNMEIDMEKCAIKDTKNRH